MAYTPTTWADDAAGATPVTAAQLNRMETGIADVHAGLPLPTSYTFAQALSTYPDARSHAGYVTTANGWPVAGLLTGYRNGTTGTQRLQGETTGQTFSRYWTGSAWSAFVMYLDADDFSHTVVNGSSVRRLTTAATVTGTTATAVAAFTVTALPAGTYAFEVDGFYQGSTVAQAIRLQQSSLGTVTATNQQAWVATNATAISLTLSTVHNTAPASAVPGAATTNLPLRLTGSIVTTTAADLRVLLNSVTTGSVTLGVGTTHTLTRIA